jgi:AbrB family looped-hinge helix DNA binding protein
MAHKANYVVRLGNRGRLVLPSQIRRLAGLREGDELVLTYEDGVLRLATRRDLARRARGMFAHLARDRDLIGELLHERREEARREAGEDPPATGRRAG